MPDPEGETTGRDDGRAEKLSVAISAELAHEEGTGDDRPGGDQRRHQSQGHETPGATVSAIRAMNGVSGGWST